MSAVCERIGQAACADSFWAAWPIPPSESPDGYHDNTDGTVTDAVTGLMWQKAAGPGAMTWAAARTHCSTTANTGAHTDWRLPSKIELLSIVDYAAPLSGAAISPSFQSPTSGALFWSNTPVAGAPAAAWSVDFDTGNATYDAVTGEEYVRCVR